MNDKYEILKKEVKKVHEIIKEIAQKNKVVDDIFSGTQIMFSHIEKIDKFKPTILLLGINPRWGYFQENNEIVEKFNKLSELDYINAEYKLAKNIKNFFVDICKMEDLFKSNVIKSNFFYFATKNFEKFKTLKNEILKYDEFNSIAQQILMRNEDNFLYCLAKRWTKMLIEDIIKPDIIICEGSIVLSFLESSYQYDDCDFKIKFNPKYIITLKRNFSNITYEEKKMKCEELKKLLNNLNQPQYSNK